jgi:Na+/proline symporter
LSTEAIIYVGVGIYLVVMLIIGIWASSRTDSTDNFIVAGRSMPIWLASATLAATWFGGGTIIGAAGASYEGGLLGVIADPFGAALVFFLVGFFFVRIFRRLRLLTVIDFFENRYGKAAATIASLTGIPMEVGILAGAFVVFVYTVAGGMWAVAVTDLVQIILVAIGLIMLLVVVLIDVGGWGAISPRLPEGTFRIIPAVNSWEVWSNYIRAWLIFGLADMMAQTLLQRAFAARSEQVAQNSFYLAGFSYLALGMVPAMLGIIASVTLPGLAGTESVIPELALAHLHPVAVAIFVGALIAAVMSSADSALLAAASIFSVNILPLIKRSPDDRTKLLATRIAVPVIGTIAVVVALKVQVVYDLIQDANSVLLAAVIAPFILGIWWKKANRTGALVAMAVGFLTWLGAMLFAPNLAGDMLGLIVCMITMVIVTVLTQRSDPPEPLRNSDGEEVEMKDRLGVLPLFRRVDGT